MSRVYVADAADVVWLEFDPQAGHEQALHRPTLVISPAIYNSHASCQSENQTLIDDQVDIWVR